jgi:type I restriction enzyme, S subunit
MKKYWEVKNLGGLCEVITKGTTPTSIGHKFVPEGINFVKVESISLNGEFILEKFAHITEAGNVALKRSQLKTNDILFSIAGALGRTAIVSENILPANTNQALAIIRLKNDPSISKEYILSALTSGFTLEQVEKLKGGVAQQNLSLAQIKSFEIPLPPLPDQKRIVAILDKAFAAIAKAKANAEQNLKNAKELFGSYLQGVFENKGEGWEEKRLGGLCKRVSVGHVGPTSDYYCDESVGIPFLRSQNVRSGKLDWKGVQYITKEFHEKLKKSQLLIGDILFVRVGANRGDCCVIKDKITELNCANIVFARLKEGNVDFIDKYCQSQDGRNQLLGMSVGAAQGVINTKSVAELIIPYPPLQEQQTIVQKLDALSAETSKLKAIYQQKIEDLEELKKSVLQKAFNGELN